MIVVSHDETFLDSIVDHVWEVEEQKTSGAKLVVHKSSFSAWKEAKRLAIQHQKELFCQQQAEHDKLSAVAERLKLARSALWLFLLFVLKETRLRDSARGAFGDHTQDKDKVKLAVVCVCVCGHFTCSKSCNATSSVNELRGRVRSPQW